MNQNIFILNNNYDILMKPEFGGLNNLTKNKSDIIIGNYVYNIFKIDLDLDKTDFEIYTMNSKNNEIGNISKILKLSNNNIAFFDNKIYVTEELKNILDLIIKNTFSNEYIKFLLLSCQKNRYNIYDFIRKLDITNFNKVYLNQINIIKFIDGKSYYPINYCFSLLGQYHNKIAKEVLNNMFNLLMNYDYEIHPKLLDIDNSYAYEEISISNYNDVSSIYNLLSTCIGNRDYSLFIKCINIFRLNYKNSDFVFLLKNLQKDKEPDFDHILKLIKDTHIFDDKDFLKLLLVLNKVNLLYNHEYLDKFDINLNELIFYLNKYNSDISFYYLLDKYFDKISININLSYEFIKIYIYFVTKSSQCNNLILENIKLILKETNCNEEKKIKFLISNLKKEEVSISDLDGIIDLAGILLKDFLTINTQTKYLVKKHGLMFKLLDNKQEELFYFIKHLFTDEEFKEICETLIDIEGNTVYHYICKNNICLGYVINNKLRNNKGFRPLDLCQISQKYYKI